MMKKLLSFLSRWKADIVQCCAPLVDDLRAVHNQWRKVTAATTVGALVICGFGVYLSAHYGAKMTMRDYALLVVVGGGGLYYLIMRHGWNYAAGVGAAIAVCALGVDTSMRFFGLSLFHEVKVTITEIIIFISGVISLYLLFRRLDNEYKQTEIQIRKAFDDKFNAAFSLLASEQEFTRSGGIYWLYQLAKEDKKYRKEVPRILCSHIRSVTGDADYQKVHALAPSNEIQTALNMLFKGENSDLEGLYPILLRGEGQLERPDLSGAYLVGTRFYNMDLRGALLKDAKIVNSQFIRSNCQRADFGGAAAQCVLFMGTNCHGAFFNSAHCHFMKILKTECQFAVFWDAQCQGALLGLSNFDGATFSGSGFQSAQFDGSVFRGAYAVHAAVEMMSRDVYWKPWDRIGQDTKLETMMFAGEISEGHIAQIEKMRPLLSDVHSPLRGPGSIYESLQEEIAAQRGRTACYDSTKAGIPDDVLEETDEIQTVVKDLKWLDDKYHPHIK